MTFHFRRGKTPSLVRSSEPDDRRQFRRFTEHGISVRVGGHMLDASDVSLSGMRLPRVAAPAGSLLALQLIAREGRRLHLNHAIATQAEVVGTCDQWTHMRFTSMNFRLAKFLIQHLCRQDGVQPYIFR